MDRMLCWRFLDSRLRGNDEWLRRNYEWLEVGRVQRGGGSGSVVGQSFDGEAAQQLIRFRPVK